MTGRNENAEIADHAGKWSGMQNTDPGGSPAGSVWSECADSNNYSWNIGENDDRDSRGSDDWLDCVD